MPHSTPPRALRAACPGYRREGTVQDRNRNAACPFLPCDIGICAKRTLLEEHDRVFQQAWPELQFRYGALLGGRFKRMFDFYLLTSAGFVRSRRAQVWQMVLTPPGVPQPMCRYS